MAAPAGGNPPAGGPTFNFDPSKKLADLKLEDKKQLVGAALQSLHKQAAATKLAALPEPVRNRVKALRKLDGDVTTLNKKLEEEIQALEKKYAELKAPIFAKRARVVVGEYEPTPEEIPEDSEAEKTAITAAKETAAKETKTDKPAEAPVKGIPSFWLTALSNYDYFSDMAAEVCPITERDEEALKFLTDIRCTRDDSKGFTLEFEFAANPFFTDKVLTKAYFVSGDDDEYNESTFDHAEGCKINWQAGKNLTVKTVTKKAKGNRRRGGGGGAAARTVTAEEPCESFFNFFNPVQVPEDEELDPEAEGEFGQLLELDYELGVLLKERLIPHAVMWYTGEAVSLAYDPEFEGGDEDDEDDDEEDEEDEEEEEDVHPRGGHRGGRGGRGGHSHGHGHDHHGHDHDHAHGHGHAHGHEHGSSPPAGRGGRGGRGRGGAVGAATPQPPKQSSGAPGQAPQPECKQQ